MTPGRRGWNIGLGFDDSFTASGYSDLANPEFDGVGLAGFKSREIASLLA